MFRKRANKTEDFSMAQGICSDHSYEKLIFLDNMVCVPFSDTFIIVKVGKSHGKSFSEEADDMDRINSLYMASWIAASLVTFVLSWGRAVPNNR